MDELFELKATYNQYLNTLVIELPKCIEEVRNGNISYLQGSILDLTEGIEWLMKINHHLKESGFLITFESATLMDNLLKVNEALEVKDFDYLADLFEYELIPFFENSERYRLSN